MLLTGFTTSMASSHLYSEMETIEQQRMRADLMYRILVDTESDILQSLCEAIVGHLLQKYGTEPKTGCSVRLQQIMKKVLKDKNRVAKHGLIFFSHSIKSPKF